jgi:uncharacterized protein YneF (UPF0154 family)
MENTVLVIASYLITFLLGRLWGAFQAKKIVMKILKEYGK